jgi:hypothetical protein
VHASSPASTPETTWLATRQLSGKKRAALSRFTSLTWFVAKFTIRTALYAGGGSVPLAAEFGEAAE